jgi:hypothetical protein
MDQNVQTGRIAGTGTALNVEVGFIPSRVKLMCGEGTVKGFWDDNMRPGSFQMETIAFMEAGGGIYGAHLPHIASTDTQLATRLCAGVFVDAQTTEITIPAVTAGTAFTATTHDVTADKWGCFLIEVDHDGTTFGILPSASLAYDTEAQALAAQPTVSTNEAPMGVVTIKATSAILWNATTDALAGGSTGTPAEETNYYGGYALVANGISQYGATDGDSFQGFTLGTDGLINTAGSEIYWEAIRNIF